MDTRPRRKFVVYQRVPDTPEARKVPAWCHFFLVDQEHEDVFVPAKFLSPFEQVVYLGAGELFYYDGEVRQIRGRPFVSARAVAEGDARFDELRRNILGSFAACGTTVDSFDEPWPEEGD